MQPSADPGGTAASQYPDDARTVHLIVPSVCLLAATRGSQSLAAVMKGTRHAELVLWLFDSIYSTVSTHGPFAVDFWPQIGLCCVLKAAVLLADRSSETVPQGLESTYAEQWLQMTKQPLHGMRPDLMLPFVSSIVETVQLPLQSAATSLQAHCRDISVQAKADNEQVAPLLDLFFLAYMLLLSALRSDRSLAIHPHLSGASLLAAAALISRVDPTRLPPQALGRVLGNDATLSDLSTVLLRSPFAVTLVTETEMQRRDPHPAAMRLAATAKRILLC